jgi:glycosyltransferase involved in cell wall biosynthesis
LKALGKRHDKVIAVFGASLLDCHAAVMYVRHHEPGLPVFLFTTSLPFPETEIECARVIVERSPFKLLAAAQKLLWPRHVALALAVWDTEPGDWLVKLAPFFIPWFRVLVKNENDDFFPAKPGLVFRHALSRIPALGRRLRHWPRRSLRPWLFRKAAASRPSLTNQVFARIKGSHALPLPPAENSSGGGVFRFPNHLKGWDWRRVLAIAESTDCRWLLFVHERAETSLDDLIPLFDDPGTFVVSRQMDFRHWEPTLLPRTPFRQLQPGEASQILAPIGHVMLIDREKLLQLGIPKTGNGCAAWFLLFWKAAAAGYRSYAVGGLERLNKTSGWPAEEREFVAGLLADRVAEKLAPQEPELARGNIAFFHRHRPSPSGKPRVLVVSPYLPYPLSHGGAVRIYNLCRALSDRLDFLLICFREQSESVDYPKLQEVFRQVYVVDRDQRTIPESLLPQRVTEYDTSALRALVAEICETERPDFLQVEYTQLGSVREAAPHIPAIWVEHDVTFPLYRAIADRSGARADSLEAAKWSSFERKWFHKYDAVWTMCAEDRDAALEAGASPQRTLVVPNGVDVGRFHPQASAAPTPELLFVGAFRHYPNVLAFETLLREIMPAVWKVFPAARLRVVAGSEPHRYWRGALDARIDLQEFVPDLRPLYAQAWVALAPLLVSAGTNIKVLEAMACGKAIVTTPAGCRGLDLLPGEDCLICEANDDFAAGVLDLLADADLRHRLGSQARHTAERRFSWQAIAGQAYRSYAHLLQEETAPAASAR